MKRTPEIPILPLLVAPPRLSEDRRGHRARTARALTRSASQESLCGIDRRRRSDRRAAPRLQVELDCEERLPHRRYVRTTLDLSLFGVALKNGKSHPRGTQLELALYLPDAMHPLEVRAQVSGRAYGVREGLRLTFRQPSVDAVKRIHRFIRSAL